MKVLTTIWAILILIALTGIWVEEQKQSEFLWRQKQTVEDMLPPTRYQGIIKYAALGDTSYSMTDIYYDYEVTKKVCDLQAKIGNDTFQGYDRVWYEILTDCSLQ